MEEILIEEPCFVAAGRVRTRDGGLVEPGKVCPFGFRKSLTCGCSNLLGVDIQTPKDEDNCHGRIFPPDPLTPPHGEVSH